MDLQVPQGETPAQPKKQAWPATALSCRTHAEQTSPPASQPVAPWPQHAWGVQLESDDFQKLPSCVSGNRESHLYLTTGEERGLHPWGAPGGPALLADVRARFAQQSSLELPPSAAVPAHQLSASCPLVQKLRKHYIQSCHEASKRVNPSLP